MILATAQYSIMFLFVIILLLAMVRIVDRRTFVFALVAVIAFFSIKGLDSSNKIRGIQYTKETVLTSVAQLTSVMQSGDVIGFYKPQGFTWYENIFIATCAEHYFHHGVVVDYNNQKYFYHCYGEDYQQKRVEDGNAKPEHVVGKVFDWVLILEPLESYLDFMQDLGSTYCIKRRGIPATYTKEINQQVVSRLSSENIRIMNCCIALGEFLSHLPSSIPNPYPYYINHILVYNPLYVTKFYPIRETLYYKVVSN